ncbi:CpaF family protein [Leucobacter luti]|uniref:Pilus assembly protein CpaF n=1 Tax=Leucobacter luti TaxID=340320 RepID=A0A4Q7U282_9MICO|nr:ATPase, T2SS/T4P/T4SS family [Leucobacter luti]MBL3699012.1 pilus assembly protein CpaF [Leucobacter luti]RZT66392.1 pilus assembly protein CpaF [Leucobacter luti]
MTFSAAPAAVPHHTATEVRSRGAARRGTPAHELRGSRRRVSARRELWRRGRAPAARAPEAPPPPPADLFAEWGPAAQPPTRTAHLPLAARRALGGLLPLLDLPELRDLLVQVRGGRGGLWLDRGGTLEAVPEWTADPAAVQRLATALIGAGGRHLDELHPCGDVRLGDSIRVHAVLPPVAVAGAAVSIRVPRLEPLDFPALVAGGICAPRTAELLRSAVAARRNLLITGGTGTGKTTLLAALLDLADGAERIVTIEDLAELRLQHPHAVALEARQASTEGVGRVTLDDLLREALRMRPDRIALGECRGAEISTLLAAFNTGHDGGVSTLHASRISEVPARLEALGAVAGLGHAELARQAVSALDLVVHLSREAGRPRISGVGRLRVGARGALEIESRSW